MSTRRGTIAGVMLAVVLATSATPALARPWHGWGAPGHHQGYGRGYGRGRGHYRHHNGSGAFGAIIGGLVIGGAIAAIATAGDRERDRREHDRQGDENGVVYGDHSGIPDRRVYETQSYDRSPDDDGSSDTQGAAVDACTGVALADAAAGARVNDITRVSREGDSWRVEGVIDSGGTRIDGFRALDRFSCSARYGAVEDFRIDRG